MIKFVLCFPFSLSYVFVKNRTKGAPPPPKKKNSRDIGNNKKKNMGTIYGRYCKHYGNKMGLIHIALKNGTRDQEERKR
jgi:hypothetical protein